MILKTAANYNDEGGYIEAWKNSDGTTEVKLIPKSGGDEGKNGILSFTISPAITTDPTLDSLFPIYWDDLTEEQKQQGVTYSLSATNEPASGTPVTLTITPTSDWYALNDLTQEIGEKGQPMSVVIPEYQSGMFDRLTILVANEPPTEQGMPDELLKFFLSIQFS